MRRKKLVYAFLRLTLPTLVVIAAVLVLMNWRIPTRIQMELTVDRAIFTVGGTDSTPVLNAVGFQAITVEKFARVEFSPAKLEVADPAQYIATEDRYPESSWASLAVTPPVRIAGEDEVLQPAVTLEGAAPGRRTEGTLDRLWARPGAKVTLEIRGAQTTDLSIKVDHQESFAALSFREPFQLLTTYGRVSGVIGIPFRADSLTYKVQLPNYSPLIEITGQPRSLVFILTIAEGKTTGLFFEGGIPVTALDFTRQNPKGDPETTLVKAGEITYPDYPKTEKISFTAPDFIGIDRLEKVRIEAVALDSEYKGMRLRLHGITNHIMTGSRAFPRDHRLTWFDTLWQNPRFIVLFSIIVWVFPTTVGGWRLYKEVKG